MGCDGSTTGGLCDFRGLSTGGSWGAGSVGLFFLWEGIGCLSVVFVSLILG